MMKTNMSLIGKFFSILCLAGLVVTCSKDGDQGPQGLQGEQGLGGSQGVKGEDGQQGEPGTANVIYSDWFLSEFADEITSTNSIFSVEAPDITVEIAEQGVVLGYGRYTTSADIKVSKQLPFIAFFRNQYYTISPQISSFTNRVGITLISLDGSPLGAPLFEEYRYIIIPGGIPTSGKTIIDYAKMTYEEITAHFNIPE